MTVVDLYTIQIVGPDECVPLDAVMGASVVRDIIRETEENLTDLLPAGYRAQIRRWDSNPDEVEEDHNV